MTSKPKIVVRDRIYIPVKHVSSEDVRKHYVKSLYDDRNCARCEYRGDRHSYLCDKCESFKGSYKLWSRKVIAGVDYYGIPIGDRMMVQRKLGVVYDDYRIVDRRVTTPFDFPIKFIIDPYDYQHKVIKQFLRKKFGLIEAPPRTGKTLIMLYIAIKLGLKVVLLAKQHEFLTQFLDHIHGNEKEGIPKCTNLPELEKKHGRKLYGFPRKDEDYENFQIFVCTYQQFISEKQGRDRFNKLARVVGTLMIDEVHTANADEFSRVVSRFRCRYKMGVTGTVQRKDRKHFIIRHLLGPIVARTKREALTPTVYVHPTIGVYPKSAYRGKAGWVYAMKFLSKHKKRNQQIVDRVLKDLENGHNIVIPVQFKEHVFELQRLINQQYGSKICEIFVGGGGKANKERRKQILEEAKANKIRVIVGIRSLLQLGLNVPSWSAIYTVIPISNEPNYKQETKRVCTPMEGKRPPIIRLFYDDHLGQSIGCARSCLTQMRKFKYKFATTEIQRQRVSEIYASGKGGRQEDDCYGDIETGRGRKTPKLITSTQRIL